MTPLAMLSPSTWLAGLAAVLLVYGAGYATGDHQRNNAWLAKQAVAERKARLDLQAEVKRGQAAAQKSIDEQQWLLGSYQSLEGKFNELRHRGPLVVYKVAPAPAATGGEAQPHPISASGVAGAGPVAAAPAVSLSLGAVWMWNSALTGADTPAGACGVADSTEAACAADAGLGLEAAWANHAANAQSCAVDRLRHQRLIDFLTAEPRP